MALSQYAIEVIWRGIKHLNRIISIYERDTAS